MHRTPVFLLTGFLGAGKTTLLNRLVRDPAFADTALVINEFGDVAIDHDLVRLGEGRIARTTTGCLCCTAGGDIRATLNDLLHARSVGGASFSRVVVETTGLADPAPIVNQLIPGGAAAGGLRDHVVAARFALAGVVTLVDIVTGELAIEGHFEAAKQIAFADRLVLTKTDLARDPASRRDVEDLRQRLAALNPAAPIGDGGAADFDLAGLFRPRAYAPLALGEDVTGWLALDAAIRAEQGEGTHPGGTSGTPAFTRHGARLRTFSIVRDAAVGPQGFRRFLDLLGLVAGPRLLRAKGLVRLAETPDRPVVVHAVQHAVFPPVRLEGWPDDDRRSRLVFITDGIEPEPARRLFAVALDGGPAPLARALAGFGTGVARAARSAAGRLIGIQAP
ncbi:CobW family GTP-binding protein [Prosthecomicrobium pneumaticum]|uniref:G3E family GTPase n=1 Tax=Prosthecomicrobium pneumaticum TaxID=81895 RepID=A0A7W9FQU2_9HYPH|nr:GTP-binding protein [Prosthecomicrobium pneumaticum]MBB5755102.1 G3E family GTPase [Prosthecomicrobium pneumaticum]